MFAKPLSLSLLAAALCAGCRGAVPADSSAQSIPKSPALTPQSVSASRRTAITDAVARVAPSVVTVQTEVVERVPVDPFDWITGRQSGERIGANTVSTGWRTNPMRGSVGLAVSSGFTRDACPRQRVTGARSHATVAVIARTFLGAKVCTPRHQSTEG